MKPIEQIRRTAYCVFDSVDSREAPGYYYVLMMNAITCEGTPVSFSDIIKESMKRLTML